MSSINFSLLSLPSGQQSKDYIKLDQVTLLFKRLCTDWYLFIPKKTRIAQEFQRPLPRSVVAKLEYLSSRAYLIIVNFGKPQYHLAL